MRKGTEMRTRTDLQAHARYFALMVALVVGAGNAYAQPYYENLVVNGDAETGDTTGWVSGGLSAVMSSVPGTAGLPAVGVTGDYCFGSETGSGVRTLSQTVDVSEFAKAIDSEMVSSIFGMLLQWQGDASLPAAAAATVEYRNGTDELLHVVYFNADHEPMDPSTWHCRGLQRKVPMGTRSVWIELRVADVAGPLSSGYFDNVSLELTLCYPDCDMDGELSIFDYICYGNAYALEYQYADCDGNGVFTVFDYICFGTAYATGCL